MLQSMKSANIINAFGGTVLIRLNCHHELREAQWHGLFCQTYTRRGFSFLQPCIKERERLLQLNVNSGILINFQKQRSRFLSFFCCKFSTIFVTREKDWDLLFYVFGCRVLINDASRFQFYIYSSAKQGLSLGTECTIMQTGAKQFKFEQRRKN